MKLKEFLKDTFSVSKGALKLDTKGIIERYRERYDDLSKQKKFKATAYKVIMDRIIVHIKVPSETVDNFNYDVLLELSADKSAADFRDCDIKVFSNCPSFVYTYAYIFAHWDPDANDVTENGKGMMIDSLKGKLPRDRMLVKGAESKLGKAPVHEEPVTRNPMGIPLFDKSIYFAVFYMLDNMDFKAVMNNHNNVAMVKVLVSVADFEHLMNERKRLEVRQKNAKKSKQSRDDNYFKEKEKRLAKQNNSGVKQAMRVGSARQPKQLSRSSTMKSTQAPTTTRKPKA